MEECWKWRFLHNQNYFRLKHSWHLSSFIQNEIYHVSISYVVKLKCNCKHSVSDKPKKHHSLTHRNTQNQYVVLGSRKGIIMTESHTEAANIDDRKSFITSSSEITTLGSGSRWQCMKVLNSSPPETCQIYSYMANNFLLTQTNKKPWTLVEHLFILRNWK